MLLIVRCRMIERWLVITHISCISSTLFAGSKVKVLIKRHDVNHVALRIRCFCKKEVPRATGNNEATI